MRRKVGFRAAYYAALIRPMRARAAPSNGSEQGGFVEDLSEHRDRPRVVWPVRATAAAYFAP